ncbi:hypothetical protein [Tomitella gaofuii]|uniref:hypothetical protein n=1 Tax=Tomitella gaofuii TaxID=2760083 RepID=UPI0015FB1D1F|nr:hypothetical protein [Tomitella gaofuii]
MTEEEIDALVDAQLAQEPSGYDNNLGQPECPHCGDDFHGLAVTERMLQMRSFGEVDPDYRYDEDTSRVICPGSLFIGPPPPPPHSTFTTRPTEAIAVGGGYTLSRLQRMRDALQPSQVHPAVRVDPAGAGLGFRGGRAPRWWRLDVTAALSDGLHFSWEETRPRGPWSTAALDLFIVFRMDGSQSSCPLSQDVDGDSICYEIDGRGRLAVLEIYALAPPALGSWTPTRSLGLSDAPIIREADLPAPITMRRWLMEDGLPTASDCSPRALAPIPPTNRSTDV